jgi:hypothetical protein
LPKESLIIIKDEFPHPQALPLFLQVQWFIPSNANDQCLKFILESGQFGLPLAVAAEELARKGTIVE